MTLKLIRDARLPHKAGEIVEVSPEVAAHLLSVRSAVVFNPPPPQPEKKKAAKKD